MTDIDGTVASDVAKADSGFIVADASGLPTKGEEGSDDVFDLAPEGNHLKRKLKARHLEMIAIGGTIGTGLLLRSGGAIAHAGPIGALLCFALVGAQVFGVASAIGEMATYMPVEGAFSAFPGRFVSPALGFASGWQYWFNWALTFPAELSGVASLMGFWIPKSQCPSWVWSIVYLVPITVLNFFPVDNFGEVEFVLSTIKVIAIVIFMAFAFCVWFGAGTGTGPLWFRNWSPAIQGDGSYQQFLNIAGAFTTAFFSYGGTELVGLTAGEAANPRMSVPRAINGTFYRILIFYLGSIFFVGVLLNPNDPILLGASIKTSPFVYVYSSIGIGFAADLMNAVIIVAATSAANSAVYACARTLMRLSEEGSAPKFFAKVDKRGVPVNSVGIIALFGVIAVVAAYASGPNGSVNVFNWLSGVISYTIMATWIIMSYTHLRFRKGYVSQGYKVEDLPYIQPFYPYADYLSLTIGFFTSFCLLISAFDTNGVDNADFFNINWYTGDSWTYCGIPVFLCLYFGHGIFVSGFKQIKFEDMDFETGKHIESAEEKAINEQVHEKPKNLKEWGQKIWYKLF
ncbi:hypothetical protein HDU98_000988 [Podochytrium sp. JEL0797]|nr:hypothetical protein HDU98_000988 [Podochytrium sp. JEL0797]